MGPHIVPCVHVFPFKVKAVHWLCNWGPVCGQRPDSLGQHGAFRSHGGTPIAGYNGTSENNMDDLGVRIFQEIHILLYIYISIIYIIIYICIFKYKHICIYIYIIIYYILYIIIYIYYTYSVWNFNWILMKSVFCEDFADTQRERLVSVWD